MGVGDPAGRVNSPFKNSLEPTQVLNRVQSPCCVIVQKSYRGDLDQRVSKRGRDYVKLAVEGWRVGPGCFQKEVHLGLAAGTGSCSSHCGSSRKLLAASSLSNKI